MNYATSIGDQFSNDLSYLIGPGPVVGPKDLAHLIRQDYGMPHESKINLLTMLNSPNMADQLIAGAGGAALGLAVARYKKLSGTAQTLMSLAGFGLGNIIMSSLTQPGKFTGWNPETAKNRVFV
jgi:hypothetical protein